MLCPRCLKICQKTILFCWVCRQLHILLFDKRQMLPWIPVGNKLRSNDNNKPSCCWHVTPCWYVKSAMFRISVYCTSSITKKAPWISPFFSSKYEEASWSWCFWVIWVKRGGKKKKKTKKVNVYLGKPASVCLLHKTVTTRWPERIVFPCVHRHLTLPEQHAYFPLLSALLGFFLNLHYCYYQH